MIMIKQELIVFCLLQPNIHKIIISKENFNVGLNMELLNHVKGRKRNLPLRKFMV